MSETWDTDRIYQFEDDGEWFTFHSPDGIGKVFHTCVSDAKEQTGITSTVYLLGVPLDWTCAMHVEAGSCIHSDHMMENGK